MLWKVQNDVSPYSLILHMHLIRSGIRFSSTRSYICIYIYYKLEYKWTPIYYYLCSRYSITLHKLQSDSYISMTWRKLSHEWRTRESKPTKPSVNIQTKLICRGVKLYCIPIPRSIEVKYLRNLLKVKNKKKYIFVCKTEIRIVPKKT